MSHLKREWKCPNPGLLKEFLILSLNKPLYRVLELGLFKGVHNEAVALPKYYKNQRWFWRTINMQHPKYSFNYLLLLLQLKNSLKIPYSNLQELLEKARMLKRNSRRPKPKMKSKEQSDESSSSDDIEFLEKKKSIREKEVLKGVQMIGALKSWSLLS
ncbi:hypothetical protein M9H77_33001 [Catharanthus roseus]|uniref:Uncharacterized protein n=1 Tax=Catharanthus roseus TaxID=4058 RepID=A0ACC0A6I6_CATRO|nr:hypothetical protein M9H77_33001 [Catharanthus roseus]